MGYQDMMMSLRPESMLMFAFSFWVCQQAQVRSIVTNNFPSALNGANLSHMGAALMSVVFAVLGWFGSALLKMPVSGDVLLALAVLYFVVSDPSVYNFVNTYITVIDANGLPTSQGALVHSVIFLALEWFISSQSGKGASRGWRMRG